MDNILKFDYYYGNESEQFSFFRIPRLLIKDDKFKDLSNDSKLLYGLLLDRMSLSRKNNWIDKKNRVYINYTNETIQEDLNCSASKVVRLMKELSGIGLIEKEHAGQGNPDRIYVKNFVTDAEADEGISEPSQPYQNEKAENEIAQNENAQNENAQNKTSQNDKSRPVKMKSLDLSKSAANYTNINYTEDSYTNHIYPSSKSFSGIDTIDETQKLMDTVKDNIRYSDFMFDPDYRKKDLFEEIYNTIIDLVCVTRKTIRIAGEDYPYTMVKDRMLKLRSEHVEYVIDMIEKNTKEITNIRAYLITALYNAPTTFNIYLTQRIQHDLYGEG